MRSSMFILSDFSFSSDSWRCFHSTVHCKRYDHLMLVMLFPKIMILEITDGKVKIGIVGDSWVAGKKLDQSVLDAMSASGVQAEVVSSGEPGAVSRQIYRNLISESTDPYSAGYILMDKDIDYLVVVAGINDTVEHMGSEFYATHMQNIIKTIQMRGIHPVILAIPEYGIEITPSKSFLNFAKRLVYRYLHDQGNHDVINRYKDALISHLSPEIMKDISIVDFSQLVESYHESLDLYENPNHLNKKGYQKLGQIISRTIIDDKRLG